eukprot:g2254.t1
MGSKVSCLEPSAPNGGIPEAAEGISSSSQNCHHHHRFPRLGSQESLEQELGPTVSQQLGRQVGLGRQQSPTGLSHRQVTETSHLSRQLSPPSQMIRKNSITSGSSWMATRWINALDRPTDFARARVELELVNLRGPLQPHHELVKSGKLVKWEEGRKRKVVLISHQWAGKRHPDPYMDQISVLQDLLLEMAAGRVKVRKDLIAEMMGSNVALPSEEEQHRCMEWDIWYDFFGIPQVDDRGCVACIPELQAAVEPCIPAYCDAADYVIILAPTVKHADTGALMNYATWGTRGWIQSWPHDGDFTVEEDRQTVETLTKQLLELKCAYMLHQRKSLSEGFQKQEIIDSFQVNYHFNSIYFNEGLTSLMLACIEGCTQTVQLLIDSKAEVNATWKGSIREVQLEGTHTALSISAAFSTSEVAACLLNAGAKHDASRTR